MTDAPVDAVQLAVQASFALFEQNSDMSLLARNMAVYSKQHAEAFRLVSSQHYPRLLRQVENLFGFLRDDCQKLPDVEGYFAIMSSFMKEMPITPNLFDKVVQELFSTKFDVLSYEGRRAVLQSLANNLTVFNTIENYAVSAASATTGTKRTPDLLFFEQSDQERHTHELLHWIAKSDDPLVFEILGEQVLSYIFSGIRAAPAYDPASIALFICIDQESRRVASNKRNNLNEPRSLMVGWFERNQAAVASIIMRGTWSPKYHPNLIKKLTTDLPQLADIAKAVTLRSFDQKGDFLIEFRQTYGEAPDTECLAIQSGQYNSTPKTPTARGLEALMAYSLAYGNVLEEDWVAPNEWSPSDLLIDALAIVREHGEVVDQVCLRKLAMRSIDALQRDANLDAILRHEDLLPYIKGNKRFQGMRLEQDLGM